MHCCSAAFDMHNICMHFCLLEPNEMDFKHLVHVHIALVFWPMQGNCVRRWTCVWEPNPDPDFCLGPESSPDSLSRIWSELGPHPHLQIRKTWPNQLISVSFFSYSPQCCYCYSIDVIIITIILFYMRKMVILPKRPPKARWPSLHTAK